eukprot:gb/GECH01014736.1/.p1 GENE.gb/GECH01014736.1/~~gb/GECH01014736.1/.p1  ORF type:complete len:1019 (+),score=257.30 gb/GECH01014736.1/:1-3057(+)
MPISRDEVSCTVIARNINIDTVQQDVIDYFSFCGDVDRVEFRKDQNSTKTKTALVVFDDERSVDASSALENAEIDGHTLRIFSYSQYIEKKRKKRQQEQQQKNGTHTSRSQQQEGQQSINETVEVTKERLKTYYNQAKEHDTVKNTLSFMRQGWNTITGEASKFVRENQDLPERIKRSTSRGSPSNRSNNTSAGAGASSSGGNALMELGEPQLNIQESSKSDTNKRSYDETPSSQSTFESRNQTQSPTQNDEPLLDFGSGTAENSVSEDQNGVNNASTEPDLLDVWDSSPSHPNTKDQTKDNKPSHSGEELLFSNFDGSDESPQSTSQPQTNNRNEHDFIGFDTYRTSGADQSESPSAMDDMLNFDTEESSSANQQNRSSDHHILTVEQPSPKNNAINDSTNYSSGNVNRHQVENNQRSDADNHNLISFGIDDGSNDGSSDQMNQDTNLLGYNSKFQTTKPSTDTLNSTVDTEDLFGEFRPTQPASEPKQKEDASSDQHDDPLGSFFTPDINDTAANSQKVRRSSTPQKRSSGDDLANELFGGSAQGSKPRQKTGPAPSSGMDMLELGGEEKPSDPFQPPTLETDDLSSGSQNDILDPDEVFGMMSSESGSGYSTDSVDLPLQDSKEHVDDGNLLSGMDNQFSGFGLDGSRASKRLSFFHLSDNAQASVLQYASESGFSIMMLSLVNRHFYQIIRKMGDKLWQRACIRELGVHSIAPGMDSWKQTYRSACSVYRIPNLVSHIRAQVHPNFENIILGLPVELVVPRFDLIIPKDHFEAIMYGHHPDQEYQSAIFVNMNNDTVCLVRRCPSLEASLLRVSQLPNGDYRVFEGGVRAEMTGGLPADALASDAWLFSNEAWDRIRMCYETNLLNSDFYVAQRISVTPKTVPEMRYGLKVSLKQGSEVSIKVNKHNVSLTAHVPPALTDEAAESLCQGIISSSKKLGMPVVAMPCGLEDLPSQTLLRTLCHTLTSNNSHHLQKLVICCPSESVCRSIVSTLTSTMEPKQINQVDIMMPQNVDV